MAEITLILGGARSGKSTFAESIAHASVLPVTYMATADSQDLEMEKRIEIHRARRPDSWHIWEGVPETLPSAVASMSGLLILDCLTMWLTRLFLSDNLSENVDEDVWFEKERQIFELAKKLLDAPKENAHLVIVSNEVGMGLVPPYLMGRRFRDLQGRVNRFCAQKACRVALVVAGCPLWIKGSL